MRLLKSLWQASASQLKFFFIVLMGYLLQVCLMPYLRIGDVTPSLLCVVVAIVTVGYGKLRALWVGCIYGIFMEIMCPTITMLNLLLYPISAGALSIPFSDKSEKRLEYERSMGDTGRNVNPYLRTLGCAAANAFIYELVNVVYMYLGGASITLATLGKAFSDIFWTTALTAVLMVPIRRFLGFKKRNRNQRPEHPQFRFHRT